MTTTYKPASTFHNIKAFFEGRSDSTSGSHKHHHHHKHQPHNTKANAKMFKPNLRVPSITEPVTHSIESVLDLPPKPSFNSLRQKPAWIGPIPIQRPVTPGVEAMKQTVEIRYTSPGLQPPVYIVTSLSDPAWEPLEMSNHQEDGGEHGFEKSFEAEEGEYQYKFRLGPGDWWVHDESKPTVDDGFGNKNNVVVVKPEVRQDSVTGNGRTLSVDAAATPTEEEPAPLMKHESYFPNESSPEKQVQEDDESSSSSSDAKDEDEESEATQSPLLRHETTFYDSAVASSQDDANNDEELEGPPLLRHETVKPEPTKELHDIDEEAEDLPAPAPVKIEVTAPEAPITPPMTPKESEVIAERVMQSETIYEPTEEKLAQPSEDEAEELSVPEATVKAVPEAMKGSGPFGTSLAVVFGVVVAGIAVAVATGAFRFSAA